MPTSPAASYDLSLDELSVALSFAMMGGVVDDAAPEGQPTKTKTAPQETKTTKTTVSPKDTDDDDDDDDSGFDVFGEDDKDNEHENEQESPNAETRAEMLARLKKEAEERAIKKEAKQRTLVTIDIKPWSVEQDLMALWKKITKEVKQDGLKWGESCNLVPVAFGIKKIQASFTMGVNNSSDLVQETIEEAYQDEVQSVEITSMNVL